VRHNERVASDIESGTVPSTGGRRDGVVNLWDFLVKGGIADTTRTPSEIIDSGRTRELHR